MTEKRTVGNDLVDLADPDADVRSFNRRFAKRVSTEEELVRINASPDASLALWAHWAAKESAYKALQSLGPGTPFVPSAFAVELPNPRLGLTVGHVRHQGACVSVVVQSTTAWLHAVATLDPPIPSERQIQGVARREEYEESSTAARTFACQALALRLGYPPVSLRIDRSRPPRLYLEDELLPVALSLSHHGDWVGFAACFSSQQPPPC